MLSSEVLVVKPFLAFYALLTVLIFTKVCGLVSFGECMGFCFTLDSHHKIKQNASGSANLLCLRVWLLAVGQLKVFLLGLRPLMVLTECDCELFPSSKCIVNYYSSTVKE